MHIKYDAFERDDRITSNIAKTVASEALVNAYRV